MRHSKKCFWSVAVIGIVFFVVPNPTLRALEAVTLEWSCGAVGGGWYTMAAGIAEIVKEQVPEITIKRRDFQRQQRALGGG